MGKEISKEMYDSVKLIQQHCASIKDCLTCPFGAREIGKNWNEVNIVCKLTSKFTPAQWDTVVTETKKTVYEVVADE